MKRRDFIMMNENIKLYQGDCLEVMDKLIQEGVKVDAIITDPPYGVSYQSNFRKQKFEKLKNDHEVQAEWIHKAETLLKDGGGQSMYLPAGMFTLSGWRL